jgi:hypothetical protein
MLKLCGFAKVTDLGRFQLHSVPRWRLMGRRSNKEIAMQARIMALGLALVLASGGCAVVGAPSAQPQAQPTLVGAWEVVSQRTAGVGKNLLTFSSDGTFFRSGDTHPALSGAHGAWKSVAPGVYHASYVAFAFDASGKWVGINRNNLELRVRADGKSFEGTVHSSNRDLNEKVLRGGSATLEGRRIEVQRFE